MYISSLRIRCSRAISFPSLLLSFYPRTYPSSDVSRLHICCHRSLESVTIHPSYAHPLTFSLFLVNSSFIHLTRVSYFYLPAGTTLLITVTLHIMGSVHLELSHMYDVYRTCGAFDIRVDVLVNTLVEMDCWIVQIFKKSAHYHSYSNILEQILTN